MMSSVRFVKFWHNFRQRTILSLLLYAMRAGSISKVCWSSILMHQIVLDHVQEHLLWNLLFNASLKRFLTSLDCFDLVWGSDAGMGCSDSQSISDPEYIGVWIRDQITANPIPAIWFCWDFSPDCVNETLNSVMPGIWVQIQTERIPDRIEIHQISDYVRSK